MGYLFQRTITMAYCAVKICQNSIRYRHKAVKCDHVTVLRFHRPKSDRYTYVPPCKSFEKCEVRVPLDAKLYS